MTLDSVGGEAETNAFISEDGHLQIRGSPGINFSLTLLTQNTRHVSAMKPGGLDMCPLGFVLIQDACVCSTGQNKAQLFGFVGCDMVRFQALLQIGFLIGCSESKILTGLCPLGYCDYKGSSAAGILPVPRTYKDLLQAGVCG